MILLLATIQLWVSHGLPITPSSGNQEEILKNIQNERAFVGKKEGKIIKRASLWDRVKGKKIIEDSPKQTYRYRKLEKKDDHSQHSTQNGGTSSRHSEGQESGSSSRHASTRRPIPSWLQRGKSPEHDSLPLKSLHRSQSVQSTSPKLSTGGQKIENKVNQLQGGVRHRERFREGFTLVRGVKAAKNVLRQGEKLEKLDSKTPSTLNTAINAIPRQITQMQYNKNLKTLDRVEKDVGLHMRQGRMKNNVLKDIAESAHAMNDIKTELKSERKANKALRGSS